MGLIGAPNVGESPLVEREDALGAIDAGLARARGGQGVLLFIEGPAGIGKTSVLKAGRERAGHAGMRVFSGRGTESSASIRSA
jgi:predicted ATPase